MPLGLLPAERAALIEAIELAYPGKVILLDPTTEDLAAVNPHAIRLVFETRQRAQGFIVVYCKFNPMEDIVGLFNTLTRKFGSSLGKAPIVRAARGEAIAVVPYDVKLQHGWLFINADLL
jgi:hypothetical protein